MDYRAPSADLLIAGVKPKRFLFARAALVATFFVIFAETLIISSLVGLFMLIDDGHWGGFLIGGFIGAAAFIYALPIVFTYGWAVHLLLQRFGWADHKRYQLCSGLPVVALVLGITSLIGIGGLSFLLLMCLSQPISWLLLKRFQTLELENNKLLQRNE